MTDIIQKQFAPVMKFEDPCVTFHPLLCEAEFLTENAVWDNVMVDVRPWNQFRNRPSERDRWLRVFDLEEIITNTEVPGLMEEMVLQKVKLLIKDEKFREAIELLKVAKRENTYNPVLQYHLGICYRKYGKENWAIKIFRELVDGRLLPEKAHENCLANLLQLETRNLINAGNLKEALPKLLELLQYDPDDPYSNYYTGIWYINNNQPDKAVPYITKVVNSKEGDVKSEILEDCNWFLKEYGDNSQE